MKLTKIRAVGPTLVDFPLELTDPEGPYVLKGADGLGPVAVDVLANGERRPQQRQIVLLVGLQPAYYMGQTAEQLRSELYGLLTPKGKSPMGLDFMDGAAVKAQVEGIVTKMEIGIFSADPEVQITVDCIGPTRSYLLGPNTISQNPSIPAAVGGLITVDVDNIGTAPSGFKVSMQFTNSVAASPGVIITDAQDPGQMMKVNRAFSAGERLIIDTRDGSKGIWTVNPDPSTNKIARINDFDGDSDWMTLFNGTNHLVVNQPFTWYEQGIQHKPAYWGV